MPLIRAHMTASRPAAVCIRSKVSILVPSLPIKGGSPPVFLPEGWLVNLFRPARIQEPAVLSEKRKPRKATFESNHAHLALGDRLEAKFFPQTRSRPEHGETETSSADRTIDRSQG